MKYTILLTKSNGLKWKQSAPTVSELLRLALNLSAIAYIITDRAGCEVVSHAQ